MKEDGYRSASSASFSQVLTQPPSPMAEQEQRPLQQAQAMEEEKLFDPSAAPPFTMADLRSVVPEHCFRKSTARSLYYFLQDAAAIAALMAAAAQLDAHTQLHWPLYWAAQGTFFWSFFVLGHDCGHGSFSDNRFLNHLVGLIVHTFVLTPYHGWRISHRQHHQNNGHADKDESWHPVREKHYRKMLAIHKFLRYSPMAFFVFPIYLWVGQPGRYPRSHFHPDSALFKKVERKEIITSTVWWTSMVLGLLLSCFVFGQSKVFKLYFIPYLVQVCWVDLVAYLQHHGYKEKVPWYRGKEWSFIRGCLSTIDRDFGMLTSLMHGSGTHVAHHLFPQIPHYHLVEVTKAIKPILGKYYREPEKSGLFPLHLIKQMLISLHQDHYVDNEGDVIFYRSKETLFDITLTTKGLPLGKY